MTSTRKLAEHEHVIWLDEVNRELITSGRLHRLIEENGLCGIDANAAGLKRAVVGNPTYEEEIRALLRHNIPPHEIVEQLNIEDGQLAADTFRPVFNQTDGEHGYVSVEINPHLARDREAIRQEARRLWNRLDRPNVYVKVPATQAGLRATRELIREGVNVHVTCLFGIPRYREAANAFMEGLEHRLTDRLPIHDVRSVASFSLNEIDQFFNPVLNDLCRFHGAHTALAEELCGQVAIASAKAAHNIYLEIAQSDRWKRLEAAGAHPQTLLWSNGACNRGESSEMRYAEELFGPDTISTIPEETLEACRSQKPTTHEPAQSSHVLGQLTELGIDIDRATQDLMEETLSNACLPYDQLLQTLAGGNVLAAIEIRRSAPFPVTNK